MEKNRQDKIDRYLSGELSDTEKAAFEEKMRNDEDLRKNVELTKIIAEAFRNKADNRAIEAMENVSEDDVRAIIASIEKEYSYEPTEMEYSLRSMQHNRLPENTPKKRNIRKLVIGVLSVAAVVLAFIYIGGQPKYSSDELFNEYYTAQVYEYVPSRSGSPYSEEQEALHTQAVELYEKGDYQKALEYFGKVTAGMTEKDVPEEVVFYSAICMIETEKINNAVERLEKLASTGSLYNEDAAWNLALAYLKINKRDKARDLLFSIVEKQGNYNEEAKNLLRQMVKKRWI